MKAKPLRHNEIPENLRKPGQWLTHGDTVFVVNRRLEAQPVATKGKVDELMRAATSHAKRETELAWDVMLDSGQIYGNTGHMRWFRERIAQRLTEEFRKYAPLAPLFQT